jgi:hypothetical protein
MNRDMLENKRIKHDSEHFDGLCVRTVQVTVSDWELNLLDINI